MAGLLNDVRVLEISARSTMLAGRILGDLGADVVTIEPPGGAPGRRIEPFVRDTPGLERSLTWQAMNYNKCGMTLDLAKPDGLQILNSLIKQFDVVLEESGPGKVSLLDGLELPATVIHTVIRPFSRSGPKSAYKAPDLILMAASGAPSLAGDADRAPLFFPVPQAMLESGAEAAVATLSALMARHQDGRGQMVEVSSRVASMAGALGRIVWGFSGDALPVRAPAGGAPHAGAASLANASFACEDGHVIISLIFANSFLAMTMNVIHWAISLGALREEYKDLDWSIYATPGRAAAASAEPVDALMEGLKRICRDRKMTDVVKAAADFGFMAAPLMTMKDIAAFQHYHERGLFAETVSAPDDTPIKIPARFVQFGDDSIEIARPAPRLSEHTATILQSRLGLSMAEIQALYVHEVI